MSEQFGKTLVGLGLVITGLGAIILLSSKLPWLRLGRLPGDINIQRDGFSLFFPITTMILLSVVLSLVMMIVGRVRR